MVVSNNAINLWKAKAYIVEKFKDGLMNSELFDNLSARFPIDGSEWSKYRDFPLENIHGLLSVFRNGCDPDTYQISYCIVDEKDGTVYSSTSENYSIEELKNHFRKLLDADQTEHDIDLLKETAKSVPRLKKLI